MLGISSGTHAHTHTRLGNTDRRAHIHAGHRVLAQAGTCLHKHTTAHVLHTQTDHLQACAVPLIANTWAAGGGWCGLSQPFEAAGAGGPPSLSPQSGNEVSSLAKAGLVGQAGGGRGLSVKSLPGGWPGWYPGLAWGGTGHPPQSRHPALSGSGT